MAAHFYNKQTVIFTIKCDTVNAIIIDILYNPDDGELYLTHKILLSILYLYRIYNTNGDGEDQYLEKEAYKVKIKSSLLLHNMIFFVTFRTSF